MLIAAGIEIAWPGTAASIPAGWTRSATMDSRHPKGTGAGVDPDVTGGAATHTHTDPGHAHSSVAHTHVGGTSGVQDPAQTTPANPTASISVGPGHVHDLGTTSGAGPWAALGGAGTWGTSSSQPAYVEVIYIVSDGTPTGFPATSWAFWDDSGSLPTGWSNPAAARDVFPKGAATGADGGGTGGGGSHAHAGVMHTHSLGGHVHTGTTATPAVNQGNSSGSATQKAHTHTYTTMASADLSSSTASANPGSTTYEPAWAKLAIAQNDSGVQDIQVRHVALWPGLLSAIPSNWVLCDGANSTVDMRGKFVKGANGIGQIGNTGGTAGHAHSDPATHTHTIDHAHTVTVDSAASGLNEGAGVGTADAPIGHSHTSTTGTTTGTSGAGTQTAPSNADTQPPFRTRAFIVLLSDLAVTIDSPTADEVLAAPEFNVAWSATGGSGTQNDRQVLIYRSDGVTVQYDSGQTATAVEDFDIPLSAGLQTGRTYFIQVIIHDTSTPARLGTSAQRRVTTAWTPPAEITGLRAVAQSEEGAAA